MISTIEAARKIRSLFAAPVTTSIRDHERCSGDDVITTYSVDLIIRDAASGSTVFREICDDSAIDAAKITAEMVAEIKRRAAATRKLVHTDREMGR